MLTSQNVNKVVKLGFYLTSIGSLTLYPLLLGGVTNGEKGASKCIWVRAFCKSIVRGSRSRLKFSEIQWQGKGLNSHGNSVFL